MEYEQNMNKEGKKNTPTDHSAGAYQKNRIKELFAGVQSRTYENEIKFFQEAPQHRLAAASKISHKRIFAILYRY